MGRNLDGSVNCHVKPKSVIIENESSHWMHSNCKSNVITLLSGGVVPAHCSGEL